MARGEATTPRKMNTNPHQKVPRAKEMAETREGNRLYQAEKGDLDAEARVGLLIPEDIDWAERELKPVPNSPSSTVNRPPIMGDSATADLPEDSSILDQFSCHQWAWIVATLVVILFVIPEMFDIRIDINHTVKSLHSAGYPGVLAFIAVFTLGQLVRAPGFIFIMIALVTYGRLWGWVVNIIAFPIVLGIQFAVYRRIGGQALTKIRTPLIKKCLVKLHERPMQAVVVLRICFGMSPMLNMLLAMTAIDFQTYIVGSCLGLLPYVTFLSIFTKPVYEFIRLNVPFFEDDDHIHIHSFLHSEYVSSNHNNTMLSHLGI